jgi:hypothetical protein
VPCHNVLLPAKDPSLERRRRHNGDAKLDHCYLGATLSAVFRGRSGRRGGSLALGENHGEHPGRLRGLRSGFLSVAPVHWQESGRADPSRAAASQLTAWYGTARTAFDRLVGQEAADRLALVSRSAPPAVGPALHVHPRGPESFFILEGEYRFIWGKRHDSGLSGPERGHSSQRAAPVRGGAGTGPAAGRDPPDSSTITPGLETLLPALDQPLELAPMTHAVILGIAVYTHLPKTVSWYPLSERPSSQVAPGIHQSRTNSRSCRK